MEQIRYDVTYLNEMEETFYAVSFEEALIIALYYAISRGWDRRIKFITDEFKITIQNIKINYDYAR